VSASASDDKGDDKDAKGKDEKPVAAD
jgi:hypothetical protein